MFQLQRIDVVVEPEPGKPLEVEGVLNPAAVRGPDGEGYLFPRMVARGNYSRIGMDASDAMGPAIRSESNVWVLLTSRKRITS